MTKRRDRKVDVALPRAAPSAEFLASGPTRNAKARRRIASAGKAIARSGRWPTLQLVLDKDPRIRPATLDRNSDALDEARRMWLDARARRLVDAGTFPTLDLIRSACGDVRRSFLARYEDALTEQRRRWVAHHGPHSNWTDAPAPPDATPEATPGPEPIPPALASVKEGDNELDVAKAQIKRLMAERRSDRKALAAAKAELAETAEALRRALAMIRKHNAAELSKPSASTRS